MGRETLDGVEVYRRTVIRTVTKRHEDGTEIRHPKQRIRLERPKRRPIPPIEDDYPAAPPDWEKYTDYEISKATISDTEGVRFDLMSDDGPVAELNPANYTDKDLRDIEIYEEGEHALADLPEYPLKEPRRDSTRWDTGHTVGIRNAILPFVLFEFHLAMLRNGHSNGNGTKDPEAEEILNPAKGGRQTFYTVHPFTRGGSNYSPDLRTPTPHISPSQVAAI